MSKRRTSWLWLSLGLLVIVGTIVAYALHRWDRFTLEQGISELHWRGLAFSRDGLSLRQLAYKQRSADGTLITLRAEDLSLRLAGLLRGLRPQSVEIARLELHWSASPQPPVVPHSSTAPTIWPSLQRWAGWLPQQLTIHETVLQIPCTTGTCHERGSLSVQRTGAGLLPLHGEVNLTHADHRASLRAEAMPDGADVLLNLRLLLDGEQRLSLDSRAATSDEAKQWRGTLAVNGLPEAPWVLDWLGQWFAHDADSLANLPTDMRIGAGWALTLPARVPLDWRQLVGELQLSADLPLFWPLPGMGEVQGRLNLSANTGTGTWLPTALTADLQIRPAAAVLATIPTGLHPDTLSVRITPGASSAAADQLPLQLQLRGDGPSQTSLQAQLLVNSTDQPGITVEDAVLQLTSARVTLAELDLQGLHGNLRFSGRIDPAQFELSLGDAEIALERLHAGTVLADQLVAELDGMQLQGQMAAPGTPQLHAHGPTKLTAASLQQPKLITQGWHWNGQVDLDNARLTASGPLSNRSGLSLTVDLENAWNGALQVKGKLPELFLRSGNPLARTLADWPTLLQLDSGRLQAEGRLLLPNTTAALSATLALTGKGLAGIYDRAELSGLDTKAKLTINGELLSLDLSELKLLRANPGFELGPLLLRGAYQAKLARPSQGKLSWQLAETRVFDGRLWLLPGTLDLAESHQPLQARLQSVQLPALLAAYPTEGLSGTGSIDGTLQLQYTPAGLTIDAGNLAAREPGGVLRFRSPKIDALGQTNPAMKLVADALHDFHYDLLSSDVRYDENGKLRLGLRLHGSNPTLEGGRPINFSINLEEDIPALLTSLQLSDRVSETIQRRVRERLQ
ncbi:YdbH domain-containing protein [Stutzerimonas stutzeri]|uniref:YdbH domain-containing protein n=1 Tax=Stutzerimonas sp. S1 TaxID=3030652 RepID=UPI00222559CE|nr:YdbH domain-containing protein [Stutzerimonas sp. S1]MCW3148393.1 YdbH domain-containing protein [Stutzerimonas sp. S1]